MLGYNYRIVINLNNFVNINYPVSENTLVDEIAYSEYTLVDEIAYTTTTKHQLSMIISTSNMLTTATMSSILLHSCVYIGVLTDA